MGSLGVFVVTRGLAGLLQGYGGVLLRGEERVQEFLEEVRGESRVLPVFVCEECLAT